MPLRITRSYDEILIETVVAAIYGGPGLGKTTLAFTAEDVLLLDCDEGSHRAKNRGDVVRVGRWADIAMPQPTDFAGYKTIAVDTAGRLLDRLGEQLIRDNPRNATPAGGLSLQGFGEMKVTFATWLRRVKGYGLDVVLVTHATEERKGDDTIERLDVQGASRSEIHKSADLMGRLFIEGGQRMLTWSPTDAAFGKNPANLPTMVVPDPDNDPRFLAKIIAHTKTHLNAQSAAMLQMRKLLEESRLEYAKLVEAEEFTTVATNLAAKNADRAQKQALLSAAADKGFVFDRTAKLFVKAPAPVTPEPTTLPTPSELPGEPVKAKRAGGRKRG